MLHRSKSCIADAALHSAQCWHDFFHTAQSGRVGLNSNQQDGDREIRRQTKRPPGKEPMMATNLMSSYKTWLKYRETRSELSRLDNRELADLGISRHDIKSIAKQAAGY
jgi:uncharacterized protein YjiS (DUF1127 family)